MIVVSKNIRRIRGEGASDTIHVTAYLRPNSMCLCEIIAWVLLTYRVGVHLGVARTCLSQVTTGVGCTWLRLHTQWMPTKGSNTRVRSHSYHILYSFCLLSPLGYVAVNNDDGSNWEWLRDYLSALTMRSDWFFLLLVTFWQIIHCGLQTKTIKKCVLWQRNHTMPL